MRFKKVFIEITNICGLSCFFCPPTERKNTTMNLALFAKINEALRDVTKELAYHIVGDPLVLSDLAKYIEISAHFGYQINITTSGFYLDGTKFKLLTHPSIKQVNFSLNSFYANAAQKDFDTYMQNILDFVAYKISIQSEIFINLRLWNLDSDKTCYEFNKKVIDTINSYFELSLTLDKFIQEKNIFKLGNRVSLVFDTYFEWPSMQNQVHTHGFCYGLDSHIGVLSDGSVVPCCLDKNGIITLGNLAEQTLESIINCERAKQLRQGFLNSQCTEELCQKCTYKNRFIKPN